MRRRNGTATILILNKHRTHILVLYAVSYGVIMHTTGSYANGDEVLAHKYPSVASKHAWNEELNLHWL
jgi:hypothetical protein